MNLLSQRQTDTTKREKRGEHKKQEERLSKYRRGSGKEYEKTT